MVEVRQEDREAAEAVYDGLCKQFKVDRVRAVTPDDDDLVQAFATHRQQAEDAMRERCAAKVEQRLALIPTLTDRAGSAVLACLPDAIRGIDAGGEGE